MANRLTIIGFPLGHSFSSRYFAQKFEREGISGWSYDNSPIENIDLLPQLLANDSTIRGFNVTIPYKQDVLRYLNDISPEAKEIGAVNCVKVCGCTGSSSSSPSSSEESVAQKKLIGYNTDAYGFELSLIELIGASRPKAIVLGTGGASKAVCYVLKKLGIKFIQVSRKATASAIDYASLTDEIITSHLLIINTTPLGMYPKTDAAADINYKAITSAHFLYDLVYNPSDTLFIRNGRRAHALVKSGYKMLVLQAEKGWQIFSED